MEAENDTNCTDIENVDSIIMVANVGAQQICNLSPESEWKSHSVSSFSSFYGLPYQDHNYGAPPPPSPPPSLIKPVSNRRKSVDLANKPVRPNRQLPERKLSKPTVKKQSPDKPAKNFSKRNQQGTPVKIEATDDSNKSTELHQPGQVQNGDYTDSVTRCICNFTHDDGYMICCDQCQVWQHIDCMGLDRENIPDEYFCEQCVPRKVFKARARMIQKQKRDDILKLCNDDETNSRKKGSHRITNEVIQTDKRNEINDKDVSLQNNKNKRKNRPLQTSNKQASDVVIRNPSLRNKRHSKGSNEGVFLSVDGDAEDSPWTVAYESAEINQYTTEVEEFLKSCFADTHILSSESVVRVVETPLCQIKLLVNGKRGLEVSTDVEANKPLIEYRGKVMLLQQYEQENNVLSRPQPFVLFYNNWDNQAICIDASSYGNAARFVRRSCVPNAEIRHVIENGRLHVILYSVKEILQSTEVTLPFDFDYRTCQYCIECACNKLQCPVKKANKKAMKLTTLASGDKAVLPLTISPTTVSHDAVKKEPMDQLSIEIPHPDIQNVKPQAISKKSADGLRSPNAENCEETKRMSREDRKIEAYMKAFEKMEKREERRKEAQQRSHEKKDPVLSTETISDDPPVENKTKPLPRPQPRRQRNKSAPSARRRTSSTASSLPASEDDNSNCAINQSLDGSLQGLPVSRIPPPPAEVGSTSIGTVGTISSLNASYRFPKTKKHLLNEWYNEKGREKTSIEKPLTVSTVTDDNIDFVITNSSPGSTFNQHRRNSISSNSAPARKLDIIMGSAKKRWLKQAMEENDSVQPSSLPSPVSSQSSPTNPHQLLSVVTNPNIGGFPNASITNDAPQSPSGHMLLSSNEFVTPLKKRRLVRESMSADEHPLSPDNSISINKNLSSFAMRHSEHSNDSVDLMAKDSNDVFKIPIPSCSNSSPPKDSTPEQCSQHNQESSNALNSTEAGHHTKGFSENHIHNAVPVDISVETHTKATDCCNEREESFEVNITEEHIPHVENLKSNLASPVLDKDLTEPGLKDVSYNQMDTFKVSLAIMSNMDNAGNNLVEDHYMNCTSHLYTTPTKPQDSQRDIYHSYAQDDCNGHADNHSSDSTHFSSNEESSPILDQTSTPPPLKKKVSLIEYRKRMKVQEPSGKAMFYQRNCREEQKNQLNIQPVTLPSLPLFEDKNGKQADVVTRPIKSLDERLALEFGVVSNDIVKGIRESTPPPPPPPLPFEDGSSYLRSPYNTSSIEGNAKISKSNTNGYVQCLAILPSSPTVHSAAPSCTPVTSIHMNPRTRTSGSCSSWTHGISFTGNIN